MKEQKQENKKLSKNIKLLYAILAAFIAVIIIVIVVVVCVVPSKLEKIEISSLPNKTEYIEGETLETEGMVVKAHYGKKSEVIHDYTVNKTKLQLGDDKITVSFTNNKITKTAYFAVSVVAKSVTSLEILSQPLNLTYIEGNKFNPEGLVIQATYNNDEQEIVNGWDYDKKDALQISDKSVKISFCGASVEIPINVKPKILQAIAIQKLPQKLSYFEGEYFDFLGAEILAFYDNSPTELIKDWDYDNKKPLTVDNTSIKFSYCLHEITKTISIPISVSEASYIDPDQKLVNSVILLLPPVNELSKENLSSIEYALELLDKLSEPTAEQIAVKENLESKRQEILEGLPFMPEQEYKIKYEIADNLIFADIDFGNNPENYKNSSGGIDLTPASSDEATKLGYVFKGWLLDGQQISKIENLSSDVVVYAEFELTPTTNIVFLDYSSQDELLILNDVKRSDSFNFEEKNINNSIYSQSKVLPVAYYSDKKERILSADLSFGKTVSIYVIAAASRELHLADESSVTVDWTYQFEDETDTAQAVMPPQTGTLFVVPIGAEVTMTAMHVNINDILVDGVSYGEKLNNTVVQAKFIVTDGEYSASVTFKKVISDMVTLAFVGYNQHTIVYPSGWDGYIGDVDLDNLYFIYDEESKLYLTSYTIDGEVYYFDDLSNYQFGCDTQIWVNRVRNSFSFTIHYSNGTEKIDGITGKQTIRAAFSKLEPVALEVVNAIFSESRLYSDRNLTELISVEDLLAATLYGDIVIYSDWEKPLPLPPAPPTFEEVDYTGLDFVNTWVSLFFNEGNVLASEIVMTADGLYTYKTFVNGKLSANIDGVYRIENKELVLKTFNLEYDYQLVEITDLIINIDFVNDGLLWADFIQLQDTEVVIFDHTLTCGEVRPANYNSKDFIGSYKINDIEIELRANGTAVIYYQEVLYDLYYRVNDSGQLFILSNSIFGTGKLVVSGGNE